MKKRICFVGLDSDPQAAEALKKAMSGVSGSWDSTFVPDAQKALAELNTEAFDAVVTNMHLPGMNGAELLQQVGQLHPKALRFVLGEVGDQELIMNCIGGTHQFIAHPCKAQSLISTIQRGLALDACLSNDELRRLAPQLRRLPTLPATYFEVLKQVESPNASVQSIGDVIACDPAATARLLQMVNSAAFALSEKVTDPVHAVSLLGVETVKALVLCLQVFSQSDQAKQAGLSFEQLWDHSSTVARMAREITVHYTGDARMANDAFTAGLLHDIGRIVLASNLPKEYAAVIASARQHSRLLTDEETARFGATHAQVGAYLLGLWGMPASLVEAAALHHTPNQSSTQEFSLLTVVHVANVFAHEKDNRNDGILQPKLDLGYLNAINVMDKTDIWRRVLGGDKSAADKSKPAPAKPKATQPMVTAAAAKTTATTTTAGGAAPRRIDWLRWVIAPTSAALIVAVLLWLFDKSDSSGEVRAKSRTNTAQPAQSNRHSHGDTAKAPASGGPVDPNAAPVVPTRGFDSVRVQAIFYRAKDPNVMINGRTLGLRERINGVEVVAIGQSNVVLSFGNERKTIQLTAK